MATSSTIATTTKPSLPEWLITVGLCAVLAAAFVAALDWPERAAFFPLLLSGVGLALTCLKLIGMVAAVVFPRPSHDASFGAATAASESVFATSGGRAWAEALFSVFAFCALLELIGIYGAIIVFGTVYVRLAGKARLIFAVLYALSIAGAVYLLFDTVLGLSLPKGVLLG